MNGGLRQNALQQFAVVMLENVCLRIFHLNGAVNHHNKVYWGDEGPEEIDQRYLKDPKVTALCALNAKKGMLGPYWFADSRGRTVTVNGECYRGIESN